ncbi:hypothetical protein IAU59_007616 [Kwoniella sp. CBS 9459]
MTTRASSSSSSSAMVAGLVKPPAGYTFPKGHPALVNDFLESFQFQSPGDIETMYGGPLYPLYEGNSSEFGLRIVFPSKKRWGVQPSKHVANKWPPLGFKHGAHMCNNAAAAHLPTILVGFTYDETAGQLFTEECWYCQVRDLVCDLRDQVIERDMNLPPARSMRPLNKRNAETASMGVDSPNQKSIQQHSKVPKLSANADTNHNVGEIMPTTAGHAIEPETNVTSNSLTPATKQNPTPDQTGPTNAWYTKSVSDGQVQTPAQSDEGSLEALKEIFKKATDTLSNYEKTAGSRESDKDRKITELEHKVNILNAKLGNAINKAKHAADDFGRERKKLSDIQKERDEEDASATRIAEKVTSSFKLVFERLGIDTNEFDNEFLAGDTNGREAIRSVSQNLRDLGGLAEILASQLTPPNH